MNGNKLFLDTNIILYFLQGDTYLLELLSDKLLYTSFINELELLGLSEIGDQEEIQINSFLNLMTVTGITPAIMKSSVILRRKYKLKLPDSIVAASALHYEIPMITADKDFKRINEIELFLYEPAE